MKKIITNSKVRGGLNKCHAYHLIKPSIWPFCISISIFGLLTGLVNLFYDGCIGTKTNCFYFDICDFQLIFGILAIVLFLYFWWFDVVMESGEHTEEVMQGIKIGMGLFIVSEVMFFFSFFWSFFHFSLSPAIDIGNVWPPVGMSSVVISPELLPLENTCLLLMSGVSVTYAHHSYLQYFALQDEICTRCTYKKQTEWRGKKKKKIILNNRILKKKFRSVKGFLKQLILMRKKSAQRLGCGDLGMELTTSLGIFFLVFQLREYTDASFSISDSTYGSTFFIMTGFHGLHVLVGVSFLVICQNRFFASLIAYKPSTGLECAIWYWHFVDVVWLFLFITVYWWGNSIELK